MDYNLGLSCEPMDIDLSSNSASAMDISYSEPSNIQQISPECNVTHSSSAGGNTSFKKDLENESNVEIKRTNKFNTFTIVLAILISLISLLSYQIFNVNCNEDLDLNLLKRTFKNKVYGQRVAIDSFVKALEYKEDSKILIIYGGTGVGKSYLMSLMLNNLTNFSNIYHYTLPTFEKTLSSKVMRGLILCKSSVLIIDDMNRYDHVIEASIEELLLRSKNLRKEITLILIYNCKNYDNENEGCDSSFKLDLDNKLKKFKAFKEFIKFESLTQESLRKCIEFELNGRIINDEELRKIMRNFNVEEDGCKGVHQKMKYYNIV